MTLVRGDDTGTSKGWVKARSGRMPAHNPKVVGSIPARLADPVDAGLWVNVRAPAGEARVVAEGIDGLLDEVLVLGLLALAPPLLRVPEGVGDVPADRRVLEDASGHGQAGLLAIEPVGELAVFQLGQLASRVRFEGVVDVGGEPAALGLVLLKQAEGREYCLLDRSEPARAHPFLRLALEVRGEFDAGCDGGHG